MNRTFYIYRNERDSDGYWIDVPQLDDGVFESEDDAQRVADFKNEHSRRVHAETHQRALDGYYRAKTEHDALVEAGLREPRENWNPPSEPRYVPEYEVGVVEVVKASK